MSNKDDEELKPISMSDDVLNQFTVEEQYLLRPRKSSVVNMEVIVRFHKNQQDRQAKKNPFVSWTLNKISVVDKDWLAQFDEVPIQDSDFWRVKIEHETSAGQPVGCFVVRPLWKIERKDLVILAPSTWTMVQQGLTVSLYPKIRPWLPWIIPKGLRQMVMRKTGGAALIIPLSYPPEGTPTQSVVKDTSVGLSDQDGVYKNTDIDDLGN